MIAPARSAFGRRLYLAASNANPQLSEKRLSRCDLVLHVGDRRISYARTGLKKAGCSGNKPMDPQALASLIHTRFLAESSDWHDTRGVSVTLDEIPDPVALQHACAILHGLGYLARPQIQEAIFDGDEPLATVWVEHRNY